MERVQWSLHNLWSYFCVIDHMRPERGQGHPYTKDSQGRKDLLREKKVSLRKAGNFPKSGLTPTQKPCFEIPSKSAYCIAKPKEPLSLEGTCWSCITWTRLSWIVAQSRGRRRRQFLGLMVSFLKYLTHLLVFWSRSWKESVAVPFLLTFIVQTAHDGLAAASSCWYLLSACCHCPGRILMGSFQVFKITNNFFAKLNFDWKECQGYLWTDEMSALELWQHIWLWSFDKARRPACTGAGTFCACVHCCQRRQRCGKPAWKACNSIRAGAVRQHLPGRLCYEMEQNVKPFRRPRSWLAR